MRQWQKDAHNVIREARAHATRTSDSRLHMACSRSIEAMVMEGCVMPSDLRIYARQILELYGKLEVEKACRNATALAG
jgi:hypothetical protein